jgi:hypothetical protein
LASLQAALSLFAIMLAPTLIFQLIMGFFSDPSLPWKVVFAGYLGIFLLGAVLDRTRLFHLGS